MTAIPKTQSDITVDWLNSVLNPHSIHVVSFKFETDPWQEGMGAMSEMQRLLLQTRPLGIPTTAATSPMSLIAKSLPTDPHRKAFSIKSGMWIKEFKAYTEILPAFNTYLDSKGVSKSKRLKHPKCYYGAAEAGTSPDSSDDFYCFLLLEDFKSSNFSHWSGILPTNIDSVKHMDWDHTVLTLGQMAYLHAASALYRQDQKFGSFHTHFDILKPDFEDAGVKYFIDSGFDCVLEYLKKEEDIPMDLLQKLQRHKSTFGDTVVPYILSSEPDDFLVLRHNDFHVYNLAYNYLEGKCTESLCFDFQNLYEGTPPMDLAFYLVLNCDPAFISDSASLTKTLEAYYKALKSVFEEAGVPLQYSFQKLTQDYQKCRLPCLTHIISGAPFWCNGSDSNKNVRFRLKNAIVTAYNDGIFHQVK